VQSAFVSKLFFKDFSSTRANAPPPPPFSRPLPTCHSTNQGRRCAPLAFQTALRKACSLLPTTRVARPHSPTQSRTLRVFFSTHHFSHLKYFAPRVFPPPLPHGRGPSCVSAIRRVSPRVTFVHRAHACPRCARTALAFLVNPPHALVRFLKIIYEYSISARKSCHALLKGVLWVPWVPWGGANLPGHVFRTLATTCLSFFVCGRAVGVGHTECVPFCHQIIVVITREHHGHLFSHVLAPLLCMPRRILVDVTGANAARRAGTAIQLTPTAV
jgi:hypothetical protein